MPWIIASQNVKEQSISAFVEFCAGMRIDPKTFLKDLNDLDWTPETSNGNTTRSTDPDVSHMKGEYIQGFERLGLDPIEMMVPDQDSFIRSLLAQSEARERSEMQREEMQRHGELLQFQA
jgi:hypothetical protein